MWYSNVCHLTQTVCVIGSTDLIVDYEGECRGKMLQTCNQLYEDFYTIDQIQENIIATY